MYEPQTLAGKTVLVNGKSLEKFSRLYGLQCACLGYAKLNWTKPQASLLPRPLQKNKIEKAPSDCLGPNVLSTGVLC